MVGKGDNDEGLDLAVDLLSKSAGARGVDGSKRRPEGQGQGGGDATSWGRATGVGRRQSGSRKQHGYKATAAGLLVAG